MTPKAKLLLVASVSTALATVAPVAAQPMNDPFATGRTGRDWAVTLGVGGALRPTYEGSDSYVVTPLPYINVVWRDMISLDPFGLNAYWRFKGLQVGGGLTYSLGRTQSAGLFEPGNWKLNGLGDIPAALGIRGFVNYKLGPVLLGSTLTKFLAEGNNGVLIDASIGVPWRIDDRFMVMGRAFATWADSAYMQTYFGINGTQSINSGYSVYSAGSGIKNFGLEVRANYQFSSNWSVAASARMSQLAGYAADSPISVSDTAFTLITTIGYRF
jgi:outer membrane scaffolding protein for murein synthesis (MipA/OmpV family)